MASKKIKEEKVKDEVKVEKKAAKKVEETPIEAPVKDIQIDSDLSVKAVAPAPKEKPSKEDANRRFFFATGRRKTATARARLYLPTQEVLVAGKKLEKGDVYVNNMPIEKYFSDASSKALYTEVFRTTNTMNRFITTIITSGSGMSGQLGATVLAISRALVTVDPKFKTTLRKKGFMTRDPRMKERKKPGLMGARKQKSSPKR